MESNNQDRLIKKIESKIKSKTNEMMKLKSLLISMMLLIAVGFSIASCSSDDNNDLFNDKDSTVELPTHRAYILNEGAFGKNDANISLYAPQDGTSIPTLYKKQNGQNLGDVAQDIIYANKSIFVVLNGSKKLIKMNTALVEEAAVTIEGSPRYMTYLDGKIYLTVWGKGIQKYDAKTLTLEETLDTNYASPEDIVVIDDMLYICNSTTYGSTASENTVTVVDPATFQITKTIEIWANPQRMLEMDGDLYIASNGNYGSIAGEEYLPYQVQRVHISDGSYTIDNLGEYSKMVANEDDDLLYLANSVTDWSTYATTTTFSEYDPETKTVSDSSFLTDAPEVLNTTSIYNMTVNQSNGDIYICTSDFVTNGEIYRFDYTGKYLNEFDAMGINPSHLLFIDK